MVDHTQYLPADTHGLELVDVDEDGRLDLLTQDGAYPFGKVNIAIGDGRGGFVDRTWRRMSWSLAGPLARSSMSLADLDADGDLDLLVASTLYFNKHRHAEAKSLARIGRDFVFDVVAEPGYGTTSYAAVPILATSKLHNGLRLGSYGILRLNPRGLVPLLASGLANGVARIRLPLPRHNALLGRRLYLQTALLPTQNPNAARLTRLIEEEVVR